MAKAKIIHNLTNFKKIKRQSIQYRAVDERKKDYKDILKDYTDQQIKDQASRCQNCGVPFCHGYGCPLNNLIPDWNDLVYKDRWQEACDLLHSTNNFPEITGRVCPALCEEACTLNVGLESVAIRNIELSIVERGFKEGFITPMPPQKRTGKKVAVIGSGPSGLATAQDLNRMGHSVALFEKDVKAGGFLRYGIPDFKLEKWVLDRRIEQMKQEGVEFKTNTFIGKDITVDYLKKNYDAIVLACGSREPRDLPVEGRNLTGIYFATDYLRQSNQRVDGINIPLAQIIDANGKHVVVIGGGDTGADCVGTANRQGALSVTQWEILPKSSETRSEETPWPMYAKKLRTSSSHEEGCERRWSVSSKKFIGSKKVEKISAIEIDWKSVDGKWVMEEKKGTGFEQKADLVLLAMGFTHPVHDEMIKGLGLELDKAGNIKTNRFGYGKTSAAKVFAAGDGARGQSLIVWAIAHGKDCAKMVHQFLTE